MNMYNALFGKNPAADILLGLLGLTEGDFYRFRDCSLTEEGTVAVYTRGGGGNRECWCGEHASEEELTEVDKGGEKHQPGCVVMCHEENAGHPDYLYDEDDDFDCTYATFYFSVPDAGKKVMETLKDMESVKRNPRASWDKLFADLNSGNMDDPAVKNALEVGKKIFGVMKEQLDATTTE